MGWDCPRCAAENPLNVTRCLSCGYQYFPGYDGAGPAREGSEPLRDSLNKERQSIREEIKKGLDDAQERSKELRDRLGGQPLDSKKNSGP